jgi:hypothetical protein
LAGYEDVNDAERLAQDPTFRLIGSERIWERGAALPSRLAQPQAFVQLAHEKQTAVGSAASALEINFQRGVKGELKRPDFVFHPLGVHLQSARITLKPV